MLRGKSELIIARRYDQLLTLDFQCRFARNCNFPELLRSPDIPTRKSIKLKLERSRRYRCTGKGKESRVTFFRKSLKIDTENIEFNLFKLNGTSKPIV